MHASTYVDLFATKGIEYLLVLGFLAALTWFWFYLNRPAMLTRAAGLAPESATDVVGWFRFKPELLYHQGHSWAAQEQGDVVRIGMDDFAQQLLGPADRVRLPQIGSRLEQGRRGWSVEVKHKTIDLLSPVQGQVVAINSDAVRSPGRINDDPYGDGWLLKVRVGDLAANLHNLLRGKVARAWMQETTSSLRERMAGELGPVMQDGGVPVAGIARALSEERWDELAREFLLSD